MLAELLGEEEAHPDALACGGIVVAGGVPDEEETICGDRCGRCRNWPAAAGDRRVSVAEDGQSGARGRDVGARGGADRVRPPRVDTRSRPGPTGAWYHSWPRLKVTWIRSTC